MHLTRFQIERWVLKEDLGEEMASHMQACAQCKTIADDIMKERATFLFQKPFEPFYDKLNRKTKKSSFWSKFFIQKQTLVPLGAFAILVLFASLLYHATQTPSEIRFKGSATLGYFVKKGEASLKGKSGDKLFPGDQIRLYIQGSSEPHVVVFGIEETGKINLYYSETIPLGASYLFPDSLRLDDSPDDELFLAIFSREILETDYLQMKMNEKIKIAFEQGKPLQEWDFSFLEFPTAYFYVQK